MVAMECRRRKDSRRWFIFRLALAGAAASLGFYIPFKYITQLHAIEGLYAFLFPLSSVLVVTGLALAARPAWAFSIPLVARAGIGALAGGWIATGMLCVPSLTKATIAAPLAGLFATFHMTAQHLFLSFAVASLVLAPAAVFRQFRAPVDEPASVPPERPVAEIG